jgi:threonine/homoserine/homoserine lactone efflux protein
MIQTIKIYRGDGSGRSKMSGGFNEIHPEPTAFWSKYIISFDHKVIAKQFLWYGIFFLGLGIALVGVVPPGLLNMTSAKISLKEGHVRGIMFSIGACVIVMVQTYLATIFARYLSKHYEVVEILQRVAFIIFILITVYFLCIAKSKPQQQIEPQIRSKHSRFFQGVLLSALNVFPIPYRLI